MSKVQVIDLKQNTPEWHKFRSNHIGASDAPSIMKVGFKTPYQLWQQKLGIKPSDPENEAMRRGKELEETARQEFIYLSKINVNPLVMKNTDFPYMAASMDGISEDLKHAVEIKVPGRRDHECAMDGCIPEKYLPQLVHQMIVCDLKMIFYFSWNETCSKILEFHRNERQEKELIQAESEFWDCLQNFKEPALIDRDYMIREDLEWQLAAENWREAKKRREEFEEIEKRAREQLIVLAGDNCCKGNGVKAVKYARKGNVDYNSIPELMDVDLEKYRKSPSINWRII